MKNVKSIIIILILCVLFNACSEKKETYLIEEQTINEFVYASGEILPELFVDIKSTTSSRIHKILVSEGEEIKEGDMLVLLGDIEDIYLENIYLDQLVLAKRNSQEDSDALAEMKIKISYAKDQHDVDLLNLERYQKLSKTKAVSQKELEQAQLQESLSNTEYLRLIHQYNSTKSELQKNVSDAESRFLSARKSNGGRILRSKISGIIYAIEKKEGDNISSQDIILSIGTKDEYKLELLVDERDISKLSKGQKVFFQTDINPNKHFEATVTKINPILQKKSRSFKVEANITSPHQFFPHSSVEANILVRIDSSAILIPNNYLISQDSLLKETKAGYEKIRIEKGLSIKDFIEIKSGLKNGDIIVRNYENENN
jgi:multidrug efflux pump subunit AcrA (membrane-fusion protein)